ncbi:hypothetical protein QCA50_004789 [Cerrena zonata]|uniref:Uncharacterized protein n=1 Tax=Cerrena zonata TaxID=2478898 RepID=A0AAW0GQ91_9APHY
MEVRYSSSIGREATRERTNPTKARPRRQPVRSMSFVRSIVLLGMNFVIKRAGYAVRHALGTRVEDSISWPESQGRHLPFSNNRKISPRSLKRESYMRGSGSHRSLTSSCLLVRKCVFLCATRSIAQTKISSSS